MKSLLAFLMVSAAIVMAPACVNAAPQDAAHSAKASAKHSKVVHHRTASPAYSVRRSSNDVYVYGEYAGSDPDPRIRESIRQEYLSHFLAH